MYGWFLSGLKLEVILSYTGQNISAKIVFNLNCCFKKAINKNFKLQIKTRKQNASGFCFIHYLWINEKNLKLKFVVIGWKRTAQYLSFYPSHDKINYLFLLSLCQFNSYGNLVPLVKAFSATTSGRVLCDKDRVAAHRRLLTVVCGICRREAGFYKILCMQFNFIYAVFIYIFYVSFT